MLRSFLISYNFVKNKMVMCGLIAAISAVIFLNWNSEKMRATDSEGLAITARSADRTLVGQRDFSDSQKATLPTSSNTLDEPKIPESDWLASNPKLQLAGKLITSGSFEKALKALEEAEVLEPGNPVISQKKGGVLLKMENWPDALGALNASLKAQPDQADVLFQRAQARIGMEEYTEAIIDVERFLELSSDSKARAKAEELLKRWQAILDPNE